MYSTAEAAKDLGVCKNTLLRWIALGLIRDVERDWRGWRIWSRDDVDRARRFQRRYHSGPIPRERRRRRRRAEYAKAAADSMAAYGRAWAGGQGGAS